MLPFALSAAALCLAGGCREEPVAAKTQPLRFEISVADGLLPGPEDGRLIVVLGAPDDTRDPLDHADSLFDPGSPVLGADAAALAPGHPAAFAASRADVFPADSLAKLRSGIYHAQAAFLWNRDYRAHLQEPGNLFSRPMNVALRDGGTASDVVRLTLTERWPDPPPPRDTETVKYLTVPSPRLSRFWRRPMTLRAAVVLPPEYGRDPKARYPLCVVVGGFDTSYRDAPSMLAPHPGLVQVLLDGDGPNGDPYQVDSANNGPYGAAVTRELIPEVEKRFRCIGAPYARFTTGGSTGGWAALALQVFYPDYFGGTWAGFPDPVDFRAYELIDIYRDPNAYTDAAGAERSANRDAGTGRSIYTVRQEQGLENVLAPDGCYANGAGQWGVWNAVFGARGRDGRPVPLWDPHTGVLDRSQLAQFRRYDLRDRLETNWPALGPKLHGKLHVWVGDADHFYLNGAVHRLKDFLDTAHDPPTDAEVVFGPGQGHGWYPRPLSAMEDEMVRAAAKRRED